MVRCNHKGCGKEYNPAENGPEACTYHPGGPIFHEGSKSWSCCNQVNKPVLEFDEFMKIPGCTTGSHSDTAVSAEPVRPSGYTSTPSLTSVSTPPKPAAAPTSAPESSTFSVSAAPKSKPSPAPQQDDQEDDLAAPVAPGTSCKRKGCKTVFVSDEVNRVGDGEGTKCVYHPLNPIFHEGSKGYLCCKPRVLEFEEFLKIEGCKTGRHVFAVKSTGGDAEQLTECRIDHYQTVSEVHVSIFAKKADQEKSTVTIEDSQISLDLYLPESKRFRKTILLFGPVEAAASTFKYYGTKVELVLKKADNRSWTLLEKTDRDLGGVALTFGVGGRTGTIGGKEIILDENNRQRN